jgi:hypothetical protein
VTGLETRLRRRIRSSPRTLSLVRGLRDFLRGPAPAPGRSRRAPIEDRVAELIRAELRPGDEGSLRLNLLIPTVDERRMFAGVRSAIDLFDALGAFAPRRRIVSIAALPAAISASLEGAELFGLGDRPDRTLEIGPEDVFLATFWTTAELARRILDWQDSTYGHRPRLFGYVIQDFEPGFYPWSAQWLLARETYADPERTVAFFNSSMLQAYFHGEGIHFPREFVFEPRLWPALAEAGAERGDGEAGRTVGDGGRPGPGRARRIVVYGRPSTPRNAFPLVVDGLRAWAQTYEGASLWTLFSVGQAHEPIDLGRGMTLESGGKLGLDEYAELLRSSSIGISLMVSPHPSLPPLEMAALGLRVITNRFAGKDLAEVHPNIESLARNTADGIAEALADLCDRIAADPTLGERGRGAGSSPLAEAPPYGFAADAARLMGIANAARGASPRPRRSHEPSSRIGA